MLIDSSEPLTSEQNKQRYDYIYKWGEITFNLHRPELEEDECRFFLMKIIEQSIRDIVNLSNSDSSVDNFYFNTARDFIFDDEYTIDYGSKELTFSDILHTLGLELEWFRERILLLQKSKQQPPEITRKDYNKLRQVSSNNGRVNGRE